MEISEIANIFTCHIKAEISHKLSVEGVPQYPSAKLGAEIKEVQWLSFDCLLY